MDGGSEGSRRRRRSTRLRRDRQDARRDAVGAQARRARRGPRPQAGRDGDDPRIGATFGRYRSSACSAAAAWASVYEAEDTVIGRRVAVKFLPDELLKAPAALKRFVGEAQAAGRLNHPHVVAIYDTVLEGDTPFIVMELLRQGSAASFIGKLGPLHWAEATRIVADCASALEAAHQAGLVHRDVKPDNILCSRSGTAKLVDFGLAKEVLRRQRHHAAGHACSARPTS